MNKSEERDVVSCSLRSLHRDRNLKFLTRLNLLVNALGLSLEIVAICLNKEGIFRPVLVTSISESPGLSKPLSSEERIPVTEAFLNESGLVNYLSLGRLLVAPSWLRI